MEEETWDLILRIKPEDIENSNCDAGDAVVKILAKVRALKSKNSLSMNAPIRKLVILNDIGIDLSGVCEDLKNVTCAEDLQIYIKA